MLIRPTCWRRIARFRLLVAVTACVAVQTGCKRSYYRKQADRDTYEVVAQGTTDPRFVAPDFSITPDPRARFADPTDPDYPPMPPDDPESHRFMHCVYGMHGAKDWHAHGDLDDVAFESWRSFLPMNEQGEVEVDFAGVVELARLHSREYQTQLETLYLSALDVTFERFRFDTQFFGGNLTTFSVEGPVHNGGESSSLGTTTTDLRAQKLLAGGGTLMAGIANSIVYQFSGPNSGTRTSLANFVFTQPLAQFAGRAYNLERLTTVERNLLANLRQFVRYRQSFVTRLANERAAPVSLSRLGGFFGGAGLSGFSGVGGGGFGRVGTFGIASNGSIAGGQGTGAAVAGGFYGLLQAQQFIRNQRATVASLRDTWIQFQALYEAGRITDRFQVDFARQSYFTAQSQLVNFKVSFQSTLDAYKQSMGLPPSLDLVIKDNSLDRFNLIAPESTQLQSDISDLLDELRSREQPPSAADQKLLIDQVRSLYERVEEQRQQVRQDGLHLIDSLERRRASLLRLSRSTEVLSGDIDSRIFVPDRPEFEARQISHDLDGATQELFDFGKLLDEFVAREHEPRAFQTELTQLATQLSNRVLELSLLQARARLHSIDLTHVDLTEEQAVATALCNRPDWMNAKAALVDSWRRIRYNASALKSGVTFSLAGEVGTVGNNPLDFRGSNGELAAGLAFDAPLTRVAERNLYRQSLIEYQQQRRALMDYRDDIVAGLRDHLRQTRLNEINIELRREALDVAIDQVDVSRLNINRPPKPGKNPGEFEPISPTAALDAINSLSALLQNQNDVMNVWVNQEVRRMLLDFDLGTMQLDERGMWIDPGELSPNKLPMPAVDTVDDGIPPDVELPELPVPSRDTPERP
ncbi:MAG TPA: TolC family protein [Caulifigura sp.]|nr:TolC family protein [Caulifigura sp.]